LLKRARTGKAAWLLSVGLTLGVLVQLHYFSASIVGVLLLYMVGLVRREPRLRVGVIGGLGVFLLLQVPRVVNELLTGLRRSAWLRP
jgi:hypothetical protein